MAAHQPPSWTLHAWLDAGAQVRNRQGCWSPRLVVLSYVCWIVIPFNFIYNILYVYIFIYEYVHIWSKPGTGSIKTTHQKQDEHRGFGPGQAAGPPVKLAEMWGKKKEQTEQIHQVSANEVPAPDSQLPALLCHHVSTRFLPGLCQVLARHLPGLQQSKEALFAVAPMSAYGKIPPFSTLKRASFHWLLHWTHLPSKALPATSSHALLCHLPAHLPLILLVHLCFGCSAIPLAGTHAMVYRSHKVHHRFCC